LMADYKLESMKHNSMPLNYYFKIIIQMSIT